MTVSVRPEDFELDNSASVTGEVIERYFQGDQTNYVVDPDADLEPVQVVVQGRETSVDTGERTGLRIVEGAPVVF